ncbi:MAG: alpha-amylase [Anaerolineales bacterium]|nr:alpha-amylase [Anaerolineales bacterium]
MLISRLSRLKYNFSQNFFRPDGHAVFEDLSAARAFAAQMSAVRAEPVPASDVYAMYLIDEAYHILLRNYYSRYTGVMGRAMASLQSAFGSKYELTLIRFTEEFPPLTVFRGETSAGAYLSTKLPNFGDFGHGVRAAAVEEMLLIHNANENPALAPYLDLFDERALNGLAFHEFSTHLVNFFSKLPGLGGGLGESAESLIDLLRAPIQASPNSLEGQLKFILAKWGYLLGEEFSTRLLRGADYLREDEIREHGAADSFSHEADMPTFSAQDYADAERYSPDQDWMPRLALMAKNVYVWLAQLSKKYGREIRRLNDIPDEELDLLAKRGFSGLWLIGLWERSRASRRIKQRMGQEDAVASAYSLRAYDIAADLGGWDALQDLCARAWRRGVRLSADMVPNHMGIDSQWVIEHPDWFLSAPFSPYPSYSFKSENLSDDLRVGIYLEDHYYDKTDAAVVFQRRDLQTGDLRYIYHGNDGTSFPWNDTAQLDYSNPVVREAVIQVILHVARNFPIIRFDAAMTLAKKHIQRLWFPVAGSGGAIPSRAQFGMTQAEFDEKIPVEFWREVVDRVAAEAPDTLLLAEAFWLLEGYFVRTLGMHRVYNSAFMHMLRDEDNAKYRAAIKNTLEFDPQILKRYVNFMSNPDEKTAVEQFGKGDKYFGVCALLATLPGLPMFGHGQLEGFAEKYGMEFRAPKWDETQDDALLQAHEWRIFPLLRRRALFADVENFLLFDFENANHEIDENVFAYCNRWDDSQSNAVERGLIVYHNRFADAKGWIQTSAPMLDKASGELVRRQLADGLNLPRSGYLIFKDYATQLEYVRPCAEIWERGMYVELGAYQCHAFMDFRFAYDAEWETICKNLNGAGAPSLQEEWRKTFAVVEVVEEEKKEAVKKKAVKKRVVKKKMDEKKTAKKEIGKKKADEKKVVKKKIEKKKEIKKKPAPKAAKKSALKKDSATKKPKPKAPTKPVTPTKPKVQEKRRKK